MAKKTTAVDDKLQAAMADIDKTFGAGSIKFMGDDGVMPVEAISTGIFPLDMALGIGGLPRGRIVQASGPLSSGKTTVALHCVAEAQRQGLVCAYLDLEYALDPAYMKTLGVDKDKLLFAQPEIAEQTLEIVNRLAASGEVGLIVVDSVSALVPRAEMEGDMGDANVGLLARLMSQALRKIVASAGKTGTTVLFINQIREKIGVIYGSNETKSGGRALGFYASVDMDVRKGDPIKDSENRIIGYRTKVKMVKNKVGPAYQVAEFDIIFGEGAPKANSLYDVAIEKGVLTVKGGWVYFEGEQFSNGKVKGKQRMTDEPDTYAMIKEAVDKVIQEESNGL
jgi:recombination protein RecA